MDKSNLALSDLVYFIQTDQDPQNPTNKIAHITNAIKPTKDNKNNYESNPNWIEVIVPKYDQRTFNTNYKNDVYDFERDSWIDPNDLQADTDISQAGKGIINNLQSEVNTNNINHTSSENNITNNIAPSLANNAVSSANKYTDNKTNNLSSQIVNNSNNFSSMASNASSQANSYTNAKINDLQSQINNTNSSNTNLKTDIDSHPTWSDEDQTRNQINQTATDTLNQANSNMESNRLNLQNQINQRSESSVLYNGIYGRYVFNLKIPSGWYRQAPNSKRSESNLPTADACYVHVINFPESNGQLIFCYDEWITKIWYRKNGGPWVQLF